MTNYNTVAKQIRKLAAQIENEIGSYAAIYATPATQIIEVVTEDTDENTEEIIKDFMEMTFGASHQATSRTAYTEYYEHGYGMTFDPPSMSIRFTI